jgi:hypothetical protein
LVSWSLILLTIWVTPALGFALLVAWTLCRRGGRGDGKDRQSAQSNEEQTSLPEGPSAGQAQAEPERKRGRR